MMIDKRLTGAVRESKKYIAGHVVLQWCALVANITMTGAICRLLSRLYQGSAGAKDLQWTVCIAIGAVALRFVCNVGAARMGYLSSKAVKKKLREQIYRKLLRLGSAYREQVQTSEVVQVAVEGVDQLETYFGAYLPQFFYAMLAPLTLFLLLCFVNVPAAVVLLVCVPLIPIAIAAVQTWAKKLLSKYWSQYTALGDTFLENLQGLTTLKIYQADEFKNQEMNDRSETFRRITMKVLTMQLNSITIMDLIAYGGAAAGIIVAVTQFQAGHVGLGGCLAIILLAADFFIPMRQLGSFFHIAMNGMAASDKIFRLMDLQEGEKKTEPVPNDCTIACQNLHFAYEPEREVLKGVDLHFPQGSLTAIVGESGSGKSVFCKTFMGLLDSNGRVTRGSIRYGEKDLAAFKTEKEWLSVRGKEIAMVMQDPMTSLNPLKTVGAQICEALTLHQGMKGEAAKQKATEILEDVGITEAARRFGQYPHEFSGGMRQRVVIAIAIACNPRILICDEPTTALDVTIQAQILKLLKDLKAKYKLTTLYITHDLGVVANVADRIAVMYAGDIVEIGTCEEVFYTPKHPYTWALLSSLPQLGVRGENLYSIPGTPPNLFADVKGDAFAPRNPYALKIDFVERPPYFEVSPTHKARTWLLDPRAPKVEPPENIRNLRSVQEGNV